MRVMMSAVVLLVLCVGVIACDEAIPDRNVRLAKQAINEAVEANAEYYDSDNLSAATDNYSEALRLIVGGNNAQAREMSMIAKQTADNATATSRRLYAEEMIAKAEEAVGDAIAARAGYLASNDLDRALQSLQDAQDMYDENEMIAAASVAEDAIEAAERARSNAMVKMQELEKAMSDAENAIKRAESNEVVTAFAQVELDKAKNALAQAQTEKKKMDDPKFGSTGGDAGVLLAAETYAQTMRSASNALDAANDAERIGLEREREFYRKKAISTMDEAKRLLDEIQRMKEQGLIKQLRIPEPVVPESDGQANYDGLSNLEKYEAALEALKRAEEKYGDEEYKATIVDAEEAIRLAKMVQSGGNTQTTTTPQQPQQTGESKTYTVRLIPGARDCLWRIASYPEIYGDASLWPKIWQANKDQIANPDVIEPGQVLVIPPAPREEL